MKDLTDYFNSPVRVTESANLENIGNKNCIEIDEINSQSSDKLKDVAHKKKKKKKSKRKPSDPAVKNVADLLLNNLNIVSPNASFSNPTESCIQKDEEVKIVTTEDSILVLKDESLQTNNLHDKKENDSSKSSSKLNAFQFMMENRNKSIGQNSPGKDQPEENTSERERKEVLSARKNLLQNWADQKGGIKRRREEEEKEEIINHKLKKRAKRLKKLLQIDDDSNGVKSKTKKRIKRISTSSSESSKDCVIEKETSKDIVTLSELKEADENAQDKVYINSKKETRQSLLTFFGVVNNNKDLEVADQEETKSGKELNLSKTKKSSGSEKTVGKCKEDESAKKLKRKKSKQFTDNCKQDSLVEAPNSPKTPKTQSKEEAENHFTPRSVKSWKIKLKIDEGCCDELMQIRSKRVKKIPDYKAMFSDDSSNESRTTVPKKKKQCKQSEVDEIICLDDEVTKKEPSKSVKVAPVFTKSTPKPKLPPEVVEARKQFLMSGIPDSLKKSIEKQERIDEKEYDIFPSISHVQQKCEQQAFWTLPTVEINLKNMSPLKVDKPLICCNVTDSGVDSKINIRKEVEKVDKLKTLLNTIKSDNPNYPVYKSFKVIYEKSGKTKARNDKLQEKHRKGRGKRNKSVGIVEDVKPDTDPVQHAMWTDKYKPRRSDNIIGNSEGVKQLKKWLEMWKNFSDEINAKKRYKQDYCSDSEFESTDCDSRDSTKLPGNTVIVGGPCGCGKSTTIYAICHELDFNVIEINASSKRTGKRLIQELQEATQSHQVRKKNQHNMQKFIQSSKNQEPLLPKDNRMCVLLIEDVDIVFEQDDGFISALNQLVSTSKRPIVLTTSNYSSVVVQKLGSQYKSISFLPLTSQSLATWLQIVCLVEGLFVSQSDVGSLLEFNRGDVRKTLLQLQLWVQSGGDIVKDDSLVKTVFKTATMEKLLQDDDKEPYLEKDDKETTEVFVHSNCFRSFQILKHERSFRVPYRLNLGFLWWNIPNILGIPSFADNRLKKITNNQSTVKCEEEKLVPMPQSKKLPPTERNKLESLSTVYDALAFTDVSFTAVNYWDGLEPTVRNCDGEIRDSLELRETMNCYDGFQDFVHDLSHRLVNGCLEAYEAIDKSEAVLNVAMPEKAERRWRAKIHVCEEAFLEALPFSAYTERRSIAVDYMPALRTMTRFECYRAASNTKRGNRFRHYLRGLGVNYNDNTLKTACNILTGDIL